MRIATILIIALALSASVLAAENSAPKLEVSARAVNAVVEEAVKAPVAAVSEAPAAQHERVVEEEEEYDDHGKPVKKDETPTPSPQEQAAHEEAILQAESSQQETLSALADVKQEARTVEEDLKDDVEAFVTASMTLIDEENYKQVQINAMPLRSRARAAEKTDLVDAFDTFTMQAKVARADVYDRESYEGDEVARWWSRVKLWWQFEARPPEPSQEIRQVFAEIAADIRGDPNAIVDETPAEEKGGH